MIEEIKRETGLAEEQFLMHPIAFGRELPRGGKPQMFYIAVSLLKDRDFKTIAGEAIEADEYVEFVDDSSEAIHNRLYYNKIKSDAFTYEGHAAFELALEFVERNREALKAFIDAPKKIPPPFKPS